MQTNWNKFTGNPWANVIINRNQPSASAAIQLRCENNNEQDRCEEGVWRDFAVPKEQRIAWVLLKLINSLLAVVDGGQAHIVRDWNEIRKQHLVHHRHKVKISEVSWHPDFPVNHHCVYKLAFNVLHTLLNSFALNTIDQNEEACRAQGSEY